MLLLVYFIPPWIVLTGVGLLCWRSFASLSAASVALAIANACQNVKSFLANSLHWFRSLLSLQQHTRRSLNMSSSVSWNPQNSDDFCSWATNSLTDSSGFWVLVWKLNRWTIVDGQGWLWPWTNAIISENDLSVGFPGPPSFESVDEWEHHRA